jgi:hypothetical protein
MSIRPPRALLTVLVTYPFGLATKIPAPPSRLTPGSSGPVPEGSIGLGGVGTVGS